MARLNNAQKHELCWLIASRMLSSDIIEYFQENHSIDVSRNQISQYKLGQNGDKWVKEIKAQRKKYDAAVQECFFSSKRNRMDALHEAYLEAQKKGDAKGMVMAVAQAHREMEGTKVQLTGKDGKDFQFNINIGPPPDTRETKVVGPPTLRLLPSGND